MHLLFIYKNNILEKKNAHILRIGSQCVFVSKPKTKQDFSIKYKDTGGILSASNTYTSGTIPFENM